MKKEINKKPKEKNSNIDLLHYFALKIDVS